jgi:hypothetical protein
MNNTDNVHGNGQARMTTTSIAPARIALGLTVLVTLGVVAQAVLAGAFFENAHRGALDVHKALGPALIAPALLAVAVCAARLRSLPRGGYAFKSAVGSTAALILEAGLGFGADHHPGLLLLHVPIALGIFATLSRQITSLALLAKEVGK